jgi:hypothetical protein
VGYRLRLACEIDSETELQGIIIKVRANIGSAPAGHAADIAAPGHRGPA